MEETRQQIRLPVELHQWLKDEAATEEMYWSQLVRRILKNYRSRKEFERTNTRT